MAKKFALSIVIGTIDKATAGIRKIGAQTKKLSKSLASIGKATTKLGKNLTTNLTLPIVGLGAASVKAMADFESGMSDVATLVDTSIENMDDMGKAVLEIARRSPVAIDELTSALFDLRSGGTSASDAMNRLERSAQLGKAGLGTTAQAARLATGAINAWGLEGDEADKIFNTIFQTTKNGITTIEGLEQGFGTVAGKMAGAGIAADDYFASIAALTTTTLKAAGAHTQMKAAVDGLGASNKRTSQIWRKLGVRDFNELLKKSGGVTEAFKAVAGAAGKQSGALKKLIGSSEGEAAVLALIGSQGDKQLATLADMRKETDGLTDVQIAFNKQNSTTSSQWKRTENSLTATAITIGNILAPAIERATEKIQEATRWFDGLDDSTKKTIVTVAGIVAVVGPSLIVFGKLFLAISKVITVVEVLSAVLIANPIILILTAIGLAALSIYKDWEYFEEFFDLVWGGVKSIFADAWEFIGGIIDKIMAGVERVKRAAGDVKAYFGGKQTSGELESEAARNAEIMREFRQRTGTAATADDVRGSATVKVVFENAPAGARIDSAASGVDLETQVGRQMGAY